MVLSAALDPSGLGSRILGEWNVFIYLTLLGPAHMTVDTCGKKFLPILTHRMVS
jgi:hypothetical protein